MAAAAAADAAAADAAAADAAAVGPDAPRLFQTTWPELNDGYEYHDTIRKGSGADGGLTVLQFYSTRHAGSGDPDTWLERISNGQITRRGSDAPLGPDTLLRAGDALTYARLPSIEPAAPSHIWILYEDDSVLVLSKPPGLQVLPKGLFLQRTVLGLLQHYTRQHRRHRWPGSLEPVPVHRLGRGTSGVLLCACTPSARQQLARDFKAETQLDAAGSSSDGSNGNGVAEGLAVSAAAVAAGGSERRVGKTYRALVAGIVQADQFEVRVPIGLVEHPGLSSGLFAASATGKPAHSACRVLHRHADSTLVEVTIFTGRPHQIRIHMAAVGHPLVGDPLYGPGGLPLVQSGLPQGDALLGGKRGAWNDAENVMPGDCGYHLHSLSLRFRHPATGKQLTITAPIPESLQRPDGS